MNEIINTQVYKAKSLAVMSVYNLIEYSYNYAKTIKLLWQYYRDEPDDDVTEF